MRTSPKLDQFAEYLANGLSIKDAAAAMGLPPERGHTYLLTIRRKLGVEQCK